MPSGCRHLVGGLELDGDRVGCVAFAGETIEFPMTVDYAALALFFRDLGPYDMPVGGTAIARALGAGLFISIHADSAPTNGAKGATLYTLSEVASGREAAALAARENRADVINGVNLGGKSSAVSSILIDLAQRETMNASARFAELVKREGAGVPFKRDYHQMAGFVVLKAPDTPAILLEAGYVNNADDLARLKSATGRKALSTALRKAIDIHFARAAAQK